MDKFELVVKDTILKAIHNLCRHIQNGGGVVKDTILKAIHNRIRRQLLSYPLLKIQF